MASDTSTYRFKRGQKVHLDTIYSYQGLGDQIDGIGKWWEPDNEDCGDELTITQDIEITVTIKTDRDIKACRKTRRKGK
jgi:hypothetical protein